MIKQIEINLLQEVTMNHKESSQAAFIKTVFYDLSEGWRNKIIKSVLNDFFETEEEFDNRDDVKKALKLLIKTL